MSFDERETALLVDRVAAAVAGVTRVFASGPAAARAARRALGSSGPLSGAHVTLDGVAVEVCVGVEGDAAAIGAEVARAVRAALADRGAVEVRIRISRVR